MATAAKLKATGAKGGKEDKEEETEQKKSKKTLIMIVVPALLLAAVGGYLFLGMGGSSSAEAKPKPGAVVAMDPITINLSGGHYLKLKLALQATASAGEEALDGSKALDLAVNEFSYREVAELSSNGARQKLKKELVEKVSEAYEHKVMDVYFTEFVMQ